MTTIYLCRHGQYEGQGDVVAFREKNHPLNPLGKKQIENVSLFLKVKKIDAVYSSPIQRCLQSAKIVGEKLNLKVYQDNRLIEVDSPYAGIKLDKFLEITKGVKMLYDLPLQIEKGETPQEIKKRMVDFISEMLKKYANKNIAVFSHGDPIMILIYALKGKNFTDFKRFKDRYVEVGEIAQLSFVGKKLQGENLFKP